MIEQDRQLTVDGLPLQADEKITYPYVWKKKRHPIYVVMGILLALILFAVAVGAVVLVYHNLHLKPITTEKK